ncbi:MAG: DUF2752 domain-containing protein [Blautia sp.]|nr:DUF2752 domain-containing protein [Blautia sp.]
MRTAIQNFIKKIYPLLPIGIFYFVLQLFGITCPIRFFTGISCAGCGMTRAVLSALLLDFRKAFYFHPLFWTVPIMLLLFIFGEKMNRHLLKLFVTVLIVLFLAVYLYRMQQPDHTIVAFEPEHGFIWRLFSSFSK